MGIGLGCGKAVAVGLYGEPPPPWCRVDHRRVVRTVVSTWVIVGMPTGLRW
jgi:hypothetical protein